MIEHKSYLITGRNPKKDKDDKIIASADTYDDAQEIIRGLSGRGLLYVHIWKLID